MGYCFIFGGQEKDTSLVTIQRTQSRKVSIEDFLRVAKYT